MAEKRGLGGGLDSLFGQSFEETAAPMEGTVLPISRIEPREDQPRSIFDQEALEELAESIRQYGLIQPVMVRPLDNGYYQIIAGERRWRAARMAGFSEVPVRIVHTDDRQAMEMAMVENLQREDLTPLEESRGYRTLMEDYGMTQEEVSVSVGKSRSAVANALRLLSLCQPVMDMLEKNLLTAGHARALLSLREPRLQLEAAQAVVDRQLSVRQAEALAARLAKEAGKTEKPKSGGVVVDYVKEVERDLENALGRKVKLLDGRKKGKIEIEFYGANDRENLINNLLLFGKMRGNR